LLQTEFKSQERKMFKNNLCVVKGCSNQKTFKGSGEHSFNKKRGFEGKGWAWKFKESVSLKEISTGDSKMSVELEDFTNVR